MSEHDTWLSKGYAELGNSVKACTDLKWNHMAKIAEEGGLEPKPLAWMKTWLDQDSYQRGII